MNATDIAGRIQAAALRMSVNTAVQSTIGGQDLGDTLKFNLISAGTQVVSGELAEQIGDAFKADKINEAARYLAHAAVGCGAGAATNGDCAGGAAGAVAAEFISDSYLKESLSTLEQQTDLTSSEYNERYNSILQTGMNLAQFSGALAALAVGGDANTGAQTGVNAAKENSFSLIIKLGKVAGKIAKKVAKKGKLSLDDIKDTGIEEIIDLVDNVQTLTDSNLDENDLFAAIDLVLGVDKGDFKKIANFFKAEKKFDIIPDRPLYPSGTVGAAKVWTKKGTLKHYKLPTTGKIRYVPPSSWTPSNNLPKSAEQNGLIDNFGNIWRRGSSRTAGQPFEWDVQLSRKGKEQLGWASKSGNHINISLDGKITH